MFYCFSYPLFRLGIACYGYSLESLTTYSYLAFATSYFNDHSLISTINVAKAIIGTEILFVLWAFC